jgi:hypothetical protein
MWSAGDGTGSIFAGSSPVGGSGINMSAPLESIAEYLVAWLSSLSSAVAWNSSPRKLVVMTATTSSGGDGVR